MNYEKLLSMKKQIISLLLALSMCLPAMAQYRYEFSAHVDGGMSSLQYSYTSSSHSSGFGGAAGLGYHYFFNPQWGIRTGLDITLYNAEAKVDNITGGATAYTAGTVPFDFSYSYSQYKEKDRAFMLTIPLMAQFQTEGATKFYGALGVKVGIPLSGKFRTTGIVATAGYFPDVNVTYDDIPAYGFGQYSVREKHDLSMDVAFMLAAEAGVKFSLGDKLNLYTGIYFDYSLNHIDKDSNLLVNYQTSNPATFKYGSMAGVSGDLKPLAVGVTIRLSLGSNPFGAQQL